MHKILILDGADKVGKSACISKLVTEYEESGYKVLPMFSKEFTKFGRPIDYADDEVFDTCFKENPHMYDIISGNLQTISFFIKHIFDLYQNQKFVIIFDRLQLSSLVFGLTLRQNQFYNIWGPPDNFIKYMNVFEKRIERYADVKLLVLINASNKFEPDNDNFVKMDVSKLVETNMGFSLAFHLSQTTNKFLIQCYKDDKGYFDSYDQIKQIVKDDLLPEQFFDTANKPRYVTSSTL